MPFLKKIIFKIYIKYHPTIFHLASKAIKAYQSLGHHILALESDMEVFTEVLEPLIKVATPNLDIEHVHNFDIDLPMKQLLSLYFQF